ncbi:uncharacterized protein VTP21DRAFT_8929 [Calcarisporiella thermophila]|uniref:uncharacterized protein n=1 Tax=Calcarisporiella thermophila TaxID=911321 RepID=UPI0037432681
MGSEPKSDKRASALRQAYSFVDAADHELFGIDPARYTLVIRQQPKQACVCTFSDKDRRPVDPPPIVQIILNNTSTGEIQRFLQSPYYFMCVNLVEADSDQDIMTGPQRPLLGNVVSSLHRLKDVDNTDGGFFVFGDLSVCVEGRYRLKFSLFQITLNEVLHIQSACSDPFTVFMQKDFPGMAESTFLSRSFADQGVKIKIRKEHRIPLKHPGRTNSPSNREQKSSKRRVSKLTETTKRKKVSPESEEQPSPLVSAPPDSSAIADPKPALAPITPNLYAAMDRDPPDSGYNSSELAPNSSCSNQLPKSCESNTDNPPSTLSHVSKLHQVPEMDSESFSDSAVADKVAAAGALLKMGEAPVMHLATRESTLPNTSASYYPSASSLPLSSSSSPVASPLNAFPFHPLSSSHPRPPLALRHTTPLTSDASPLHPFTPLAYPKLDPLRVDPSQSHPDPTQPSQGITMSSPLAPITEKPPSLLSTTQNVLPIRHWQDDVGRIRLPPLQFNEESIDKRPKMMGSPALPSKIFGDDLSRSHPTSDSTSSVSFTPTASNYNDF